MPNYRRRYFEGGLFFFTVNLLDRSDNLLVRHIDLFRRCYGDLRERAPVETLAIAVMPDHFHCVWRLPKGDLDYSTRLKTLKASFSERLPRTADASVKRRRGERGVWQR
jgi:putative transposase